MDEEYWLDKVDVWIENQIKGDYNDNTKSKHNGRIVRTRNWVTRMGKRLDAQKKSAQNEQSTVIKRLSGISKRTRI
jgi:hypothetical protein